MRPSLATDRLSWLLTYISFVVDHRWTFRSIIDIAIDSIHIGRRIFSVNHSGARYLQPYSPSTSGSARMRDTPPYGERSACAGKRGCFGLWGGKFSKFLASKGHTRRKFLATDVHLLWGTSVCVPQSPKWGWKVGLNSFFANLWRRKRQPSWLLTTFTTSVFCPVFSSSKLKAERVSGGVVFLATNRLGHSCLCPGVSPRQKIDVIFLALCR